MLPREISAVFLQRTGTAAAVTRYQASLRSPHNALVIITRPMIYHKEGRASAPLSALA